MGSGNPLYALAVRKRRLPQIIKIRIIHKSNVVDNLTIFLVNVQVGQNIRNKFLRIW